LKTGKNGNLNESMAPNVDIVGHFWAMLIASFRERLNDSHIVQFELPDQLK